MGSPGKGPVVVRSLLHKVACAELVAGNIRILGYTARLQSVAADGVQLVLDWVCPVPARLERSYLDLVVLVDLAVVRNHHMVACVVHAEDNIRILVHKVLQKWVADDIRLTAVGWERQE